tara:strand:+ start:15850 stop:17970 length:2121 start_codon:yes stop_codon:yes gene_type:complete
MPNLYITNSTFRRVQEREEVSFSSNVSCSNCSGSGFFGLSGESSMYKFTFFSGKLLDPENEYVYGFKPNSQFNISGNLNNSGYSYYIDGKPIKFNGSKVADDIHRIIADASGCALDIDLKVFGHGSGMADIDFVTTIRSGQISSGTVNNVGSGKAFDVFSGSFNSPYADSLTFQDFPSGVETSKGFTVSGSAGFPANNYFTASINTSFGPQQVTGIYATGVTPPETISLSTIAFINKDDFVSGEYTASHSRQPVGQFKSGEFSSNYFIPSSVAPSGFLSIELSHHSGYTGVIGSGITGVNVTNSGDGYFYNPFVEVTNGGSGALVTAYAQVDSGVVSGVAVNHCGSGYSNANFTIYENISGFNVVSGGSGYMTSPTIIVSGGGVTPYSGRAGGVLDKASVNTLSGYVFEVGLANNFQPTGYTSVPTVQIKSMVSGLAIDTSGSNYNGEVPTVSINGGGGSFATGECLLGYSITGISVSHSGSGYVTAPTVIIDSTAIYDASGQAFIDSSGYLTGISMLAIGSGYGPTHPSITLSGGAPAITGSGIAQTGSGQITGTSMTSHGYDYDSIPTVTLSEGNGVLSAVMATGAHVEAVLSSGLAISGEIGSYEKSFSGMWMLMTGNNTFDGGDLRYIGEYDPTVPRYYNINATGEPVPSGRTTITSQVSYFDRPDNLPIVAAMTISGSGVSSEPVSDVMQTIYITGVGIDG